MQHRKIPRDKCKHKVQKCLSSPSFSSLAGSDEEVPMKSDSDSMSDDPDLSLVNENIKKPTTTGDFILAKFANKTHSSVGFH